MNKKTDEAIVRAKIMRLFNYKVKGQPNALRQAQINKLITNVRASYPKGLLEKMQAEELIDCHWREWKSKEESGGIHWSIWDHSENIKTRIWRKEQDEEWERIEKYHAQQKRLWEIENAPRLARERFQKRLNEFFIDNEKALFEVFTGIYSSHKRTVAWIHSRPTKEYWSKANRKVLVKK